ncbi:MAG: response regulator [Bacteroidales bacterium]|nr:response regulator [Bacteroidales bacterium]
MILLIEKDEYKQKTMQKHLQIEGFNVFSEISGSKAIEIINALLPDIVLCNEKTKELSGYDIYNSIQKESRTKNIPFIFLSDFNLFNTPSDKLVDDQQIHLKYPSLVFHINKRLSQAGLYKKKDYYFT